MDELIKENELIKEIKDIFPTTIDMIEVRRKRRIWIDVTVSNLLPLLKFLKEKGYYHLSTITGFDEGEKLGAIYHITDRSIVVNVRTRVPKTDPKIPSVLGVYPSATSYEREISDLFGIEVEGLPPGRNYPLPEGFPKGIHPLRKDVNLDELNKMLNEKDKEEK